MSDKPTITVKTTVNAPLEKVWSCWTEPEHITHWNRGSADWVCPWAKNDLRVGGNFSSRMEKDDGSVGFEFGGTYTAVELMKHLAYDMGDGRHVEVMFQDGGDHVDVVETFEAESQNSLEMQQAGWQTIVDNFKNYVEKE
jgi:uncharacterized protein YndB with AHSA1/START domain